MNSEFRETPYIRLQGKWLKQIGFNVGSQFVVLVKENKIELKICEE